jgi:hypothetical protein
MKIKALIKTPKGQATKAQNTLQNVIFGKLWRKYDHFDSYVNDADSEVAWEIETRNVRDYVRISRNLAMYEVMIRHILASKRIKEYAQKQFSKEDMLRLRQMLQEQTTIEIIKEATAAEIVEGNKTFWQRLKDRMKKI